MTIEITRLNNTALRKSVQHRIDNKTKPLASLGRLEALALQLALIQNSETVTLISPQLVIFAADHGITAQGVSAYPSEVTAQMVGNMLAGGAAVSVLARQHGLALTIVDCGVKADFAPHSNLSVRKVSGARYGTADSTITQAMTPTQCESAIANGRALLNSLPGNVLLLGEMGIGNTSAAALIMSRLTGLPLHRCVGRGTGLDDDGLNRKIETLQRALNLHIDATKPMSILAALGGLEIATMVGAIFQAAIERRIIVVDGFITTAAVAIAAAIAPAVLEYCVFAHCSAESGHALWLTSLSASPLIDLGLRLGEGSGAALAWPLLKSAELLLAEMASFESAGVAEKSISQ
jgi:nicotinate-nucleotide--dimethylbenzimidazole phosphoribosyltransferase